MLRSAFGWARQAWQSRCVFAGANGGASQLTGVTGTPERQPGLEQGLLPHAHNSAALAAAELGAGSHGLGGAVPPGSASPGVPAWGRRWP